ncbi:hypothetical protein C8Q72DRAFT_151589 [Fomitopsis betulina]|nr:hypothetical protein C8Q72DRAFT_151589 [Fomitopsis betulina]
MPAVFENPPISLSTAHWLAGLFAGSYVGSLYLSKLARLSFRKGRVQLQQGEQRGQAEDERWRDDPEVIRARLVAVSMSTLSSGLAVLGLVWKLLRPNDLFDAVETTFVRLGFDFSAARSLLPCLVTPVLFIGPLYVYWLSGSLPLQRNWSWRWSLLPLFTTWQGVRNYVVGPITEELVFRCCSLAVYHLAGASKTRMIFMTPWLFGLAHAHHAWDTYNRYGRTGAAAKRALFAAVFQTAYTSLFGFHCAYLFLRTGSLLPPITAHIFCNIMGLPQYGEHIVRFPRHRRAIKVAYLLGIVGYVYTMSAWTLTLDSLYWRPAGGSVAGMY